jgi:prepilin-type N-terminal cleavage/methylation domain-containing protein
VIARLRRRCSLPNERGFTIVELLAAMSIMGIVLGGLTTVFVSGSTAELGTNRRFQAQADGRLALDKLRTDVHCASSATTTSSSVTLTMPAGCRSASNTTVTWCTSAVGGSTTRYALYRYQSAGTCQPPAVLWADYLTQASAFTFTQQSSTSLAKVRAYLPINLSPGRMRTYALQDDIYLRNSTRTCVTGSPSPPC